ncbi:MAG: hypothetical protein DRI86_06370 [Bacteroidetes bacterium]|nr:MAG: hypothetical protein DRI86_06370 [Bacteroidota bacterium]
MWGTYNQGQICNLVASAASNFVFNNWTDGGNIVSTDTLYSFVVNSDRSLIANFSSTIGIKGFKKNTMISVYPNPFKNTTNIKYTLNKSSKVVLGVYSSIGKNIAVLVNEKQDAGSYQYQFKALEYGYTTGVLFLRMIVDNDMSVIKLIEIK